MMKKYCLALIIAIAIIIIVIMFTKNPQENFCSSCTGPIMHRYKYGDPFYTYMYEQRRKYKRYPKGKVWMNVSKKQRNEDRTNLKNKMNNWLQEMSYDKYGNPPNTSYVYDDPLMNPVTKKETNRYRYIINDYLGYREPDRPWEYLP